jgi:hypothetical protein
MGLPVLIGAGVGGLTSALRGKNILKGAALGGALGGVGGGIDGLLKGGSFLEGAGLGGLSGATGEAVSQGAGGLLGATGSAGTGASLIPTIAESATPAISGSIGSDGLVQVGDTFYNPEYFANMSGASPIYTGNGSLLDKLSMGAQSVGSDFSSMMPSNFGVDNLQGAAQIAMGQPVQASPIASKPIQVGQAPSSEGYAQFMQQYYSPYKKQRTDLGV